MTFISMLSKSTIPALRILVFTFEPQLSLSTAFLAKKVNIYRPKIPQVYLIQTIVPFNNCLLSEELNSF